MPQQHVPSLPYLVVPKEKYDPHRRDDSYGRRFRIIELDDETVDVEWLD